VREHAPGPARASSRGYGENEQDLHSHEHERLAEDERREGPPHKRPFARGLPTPVSTAQNEENQLLEEGNYRDKRERERERDESALLTHLPTGALGRPGIPITFIPNELMRTTSPSSF